MVRKRILIPTLLLISLLCSGFACDRKKVATASRNVAASVRAFQVAEIDLHKQGKVSTTEHQVIQKYLLAVGTAGLSVDSCILQSSAVTCVDTGLTAANNLLNQGVLPITDVNTRQQLQLAAQLIITGFNTLKAAL